MKREKRMLSMLLVIGMVSALMPGVFVSADEHFEYDFFENGWVQKYDLLDEEEQKETTPYAEVVDLGGDRGEVIRINDGYTSLPISSKVFDRMLDETLVFSFKFMSECLNKSVVDENEFVNMYAKDGRVGQISWNDQNNRPGFVTNPNGDFSFYVGDTGNWIQSENKLEGYGKDKQWYQVDCIYDLEKRTIKHYVDGTFLGENPTGPDYLDYIMLYSSTDKTGDEGQKRASCNVYFDDITLTELGQNITVEYSEASSSDEYAVFNFSEPVANTSGIMLCDIETGEKTAAQLEKVNELTYRLPVSVLKAGAEYKLDIPAGISGAYGNTTKASSVLFNAPDEAVVSGRANVGTVRFNDDFSDYTEISDSASVETTLEADGVNRWALSPNGNTHYQIKNVNGSNALYIDMSKGTAKYEDNAMVRNNYPEGGSEFIKSGVTDIYFDMALGNPVTNDQIKQTTAEDAKAAKNYVTICLPTNNNSSSLAYYYTLFKIDGSGTISKYKPNYQWAGDLSYKDDRDISTIDKYKITVDYNQAKIYVMLYDSEKMDYVELYNVELDVSKMGNDGFRGIEFRPGRSTSVSDLADGTGVYVDNVKIIERDTDFYYDFEDDFSSYTALGYAVNTNDSNNITTIENPVWSQVSSGGTNWGKGLYPYSLNGNNVLRIDNWQTDTNHGVRAITKMSHAAVNSGLVEYTFDAGVQDPEENGEDLLSFIVGFDVVGSSAERKYPFTVMNITERGKILCYTNNCDYGATQTAEGYTDENNLSMNTYKIAADFTQKKVFTYILDNGSYVKIGESTMHPDMITYGIRDIAFELTRKATKVLATNSSAVVDNVKVDFMDKYIVPEVSAVRIGGEVASDSVDVQTDEVKIYFNKKMNEELLKGITITGIECEPGVYDGEENSYTLNVTDKLMPVTEYSINVPQTVTDSDGNAIGRAYAGTFKTQKGELLVTEFSLKEGDAIATLASTDAGDTLTAKASLKNYAAENGNYVLMYAIYDDEKLVKVDFVNVPYSESEIVSEEDIPFEIPETAGELGVKVMLWNSFTGIGPVKEAIVLQ